ncbi:MAG: MATE family efflux transporter [Clostridia bacterium]|nr:MATE family efflux transporter [Clostridia bacterium]
MTKDFTTGSPTKQIFFFALPFLIGNLFQQFYNIADTVIVGRMLGPDALAAVGSTGSMIWFFCGFICTLTAGFAAVLAYYFGAHRPEKVKHVFGMSIILSAIFGVAFTLLSSFFAMPILKLLRTPFENDIIYMAYDYIIWVFIGLIGTTIFNLLSNAIRSFGDSKTPLYFLIFSCVVNIALDILLIPVMGTAGAGLATAIAQFLSGILCIVFIAKKQPILHIRRRHFTLNWRFIKHLLKIGVPMGALNLVLSIGSIVMQFTSNTLGSLYMASQTAAAKIEQFVTQPLLSIGSAVSFFVAQNHGAHKFDRIKKGVSKALLLGNCWCVIAVILMVLFGKALLGAIVGPEQTEIIKNGFTYNIINTVSSFIVCYVIILKAALQAIGRPTGTMISGFTEIAGRAVSSLGALMIFSTPATQFLGICFGNPLAWLFGLIPIGIDYLIVMKDFKNPAKTEQE